MKILNFLPKGQSRRNTSDFLLSICSNCYSTMLNSFASAPHWLRETSWLIVFLAGFSVFSDNAVPDFLDSAEVLKSAESVTREAYPNADEVLVDDYIVMDYRKDGTSVTYDDTFLKILTEKGRRDNQALSFHFTAPYSRVKLLKLEIIRPDGSTAPVDFESQSRIMVESGQMDSNIFNPNAKVLKVNIPGLQAGDIVRYVFKREDVKTRVPDTWSEYQVLEYTSPIKRYVLEVNAPEKLPLKHKVIRDRIPGSIKYRSEKTDTGARHTWEIKDVPRIYREPSMPPLYSVVQRLLLSTVGSWEDISIWYWNLSLPHLEKTTPEMNRKVDELVSGLETPMDKIKAVFRFVSQDIRYMGITTEETAPGYEPHDVSVTFKNRYGVCRDKAALLVAMFRIAGFDAYPVLIMNGPKKDPEVPNPYFNHAIACVQMEDGSYLLMDPTDENTRELLPAYLCNNSYLVAKPEGETLKTSPVIPAEKNMMQTDTRAVWDGERVNCETQMRFEGINDGAYRGYFAGLEPLQRKQFFERVLKRVLPGAEISGFTLLPDDIRDTSIPMTARITYSAPDIIVKGGGKALLSVPWVGERFGIVNFILGNTGLEKRKYPFVTDIACGVREKLELKLPQSVGADLSIPGNVNIDRGGVAWSQSLSLDGRSMLAEGSFKLKSVEFSPEEYLILKEILKKTERERRKRPVFESAPSITVDADAVFERDDTVLRIDSADSWTETRKVRKKILSYAGKKKNSELKFRFNPVWEDVEVRDVKVFTADGSEIDLRDEEVNLMDQDWTGGAPRYPPGKILVVNMPGVDINSVLEYTVVRSFRNQPFFEHTHLMKGSQPIISRSLKLEGAVNLPGLKTGGMDIDKLAREGTRTWRAENVEMVKSEPSMPPSWSHLPAVILSSGDWRAYSEELSCVLEKKAEPGKELRARAAELRKKFSGDRKRLLKGVRDFVDRAVKNAGPGFTELPLSELSSADTTLRDGYGNNADKAILLYSLLSESGFSPEYALFSNIPDLPSLRSNISELPRRHIFSRILVSVQMDGMPVYLGLGSQYGVPGALPREGRIGLSVCEGGLLSVGPGRDLETSTETDYEISLEEDGTARIDVTNIYYGYNYGSMNRKYSEMPPEERRRHLQKIASIVSQSARVEGKLETDFSSYPGKVSYSFTVPGYAVVDGRFMYFELPEDLRGVVSAGLDERSTPLYTGNFYRRSINCRISIPGKTGLKPSIAPVEKLWTLPRNAGTVMSSSRWLEAENILLVSQNVRLLPAIIPPSKYDKIKSISRESSHDDTRTVLFERK